MIEYIFPPAMALLSAWSGGSLWPSQYLPDKLTWLPEALFAACIGYALYPVIGWYCLIGVAWSYVFMQSATAPGLHWGDGSYNPNRTSTLKPLVDWLSPWHPSTVEYCRVYMAVKGFLISLPIGGLGAIGWPLGYELGHRLGSNTYRELLAGLFMGLNVYLFLVVLERF